MEWKESKPMRPRTIEYNRLFEVIKERDEWILPKRKNRRNTPIFDLDEKRWCSIERSKDRQWFILFYKDQGSRNNPVYYKSFVRAQNAQEEKLILLFSIFSEVTRNIEGKWVNKTGKFIEEHATGQQ